MEISKAIALYEAMASRMEASGRAPYQAKVYRDTIEFMRECETAEEAMDKIRNSPYYLAPTKALMQDKLTAYRDAALANKMPDVAAVYEKKLAEIEADADAVYTTGYEQAARRESIKYLDAAEAFGTLYEKYTEILLAQITDTEKIMAAQQAGKQLLASLRANGFDFAQMAQEPVYRNLIFASDAGYAAFVQNLAAVLDTTPDNRAEGQALQNERDTAWAQLKAAKKEISKMGKPIAKAAKTARTLVVAPQDAAGTYTYMDEEVR